MSESMPIGWLGPTNDHWSWILGHFRDVSIILPRNIEEWVIAKSRATLFIAIESRFDPVLDLVRRLEKTIAPIDDKTRAMPWCLLLGSDWVGHRRTYPLPEAIATFYWYELHDRLIPWLVSQSQTDLSITPTHPNNASSNRPVSPRVQRLIETSLSIGNRQSKSTAKPIRLALIVAETATTRQLWCETLSPHEIQCVATTPDNLELWTTPDLVIVDIESEPMAIRELQLAEEDGGFRERLVRKLTSQFPAATILVADAFPRWETWRALLEFGADFMVAKPFQLTGILDTLRAIALSRPTDPA